MTMRRLLCLVSLFALPWGCATHATLPAFSFVGSSAAPEVRVVARPSHEFVFTCQNGSVFDCLVYTARGTLKRTLTKSVKSPMGVAAGKDGRLYVANEFGDDLLVYSAGGRKLLKELANDGNVPIDVAVFDGDIAAANQHVVTFFAEGAMKPTRTLNAPNVLQGSGAAFDARGNCYWSFVDNQGESQVVEFARCKGNAHNLRIAAGSPYGLAFDAAGNLYYTSYSSNAPGVYRCTGTASCKRIYNQFVDPEYVNFSHDFKDLWVNDPGTSSKGSALYEIDVASGKVIETITAGLTSFNPPTGVAAAPGPL